MRVALCLVLTIAFCGPVTARPHQEAEMKESDGGPVAWSTLEIGDEITVTGIARVFGNEPHTFLALVVPDPERESGERLVQVSGDLEDELWNLQNARVTVTGEVRRLEVGPGFPLEILVSSYHEEHQ